MKTFLILTTLFFFPGILSAQSTFKRNDIYFELGGNGLFGAVNYERQLTNQPGLGCRFGIGAYAETSFYLTIPLGINYLFPLGSDKSLIEAGVGVTFARVDGRIFSKEGNLYDDHFTNFIPSIGYRRHTKHSVMWRINISPVINNFGTTPWLGISVGKRF
jgi:hypothetical protein